MARLEADRGAVVPAVDHRVERNQEPVELGGFPAHALCFLTSSSKLGVCVAVSSGIPYGRTIEIGLPSSFRQRKNWLG
jgi:hypothetical protein